MVKVLVSTQEQLRGQIVLCNEGTELLFFRMAHAPRVYDSGLSALLIVEDVGVFLHWSEGELLYLKHRMVINNRIQVIGKATACVSANKDHRFQSPRGVRLPNSG